MNVERALVLEQVLRTVPRRKFDMDNWQQQKFWCGTVACAGGWACLTDAFQRQGLLLDSRDDFYFPSYDGREGYAALAKFFDLSDAMARRWFDPDTYPEKDPSPTVVADRIRDDVEWFRSTQAAPGDLTSARKITEEALAEAARR